MDSLPFNRVTGQLLSLQIRLWSYPHGSTFKQFRPDNSLKMLYHTGPLGFTRWYPQTCPPFTTIITTRFIIPTDTCIYVDARSSPPFFFNLHHPLPRGYHLHCTPCPRLTILSRCSVADTAFLDASPSAVGRNRPPSPPPRYPTSRSLNSSTGCVDQGVARVSLPRIP